MFVFLALQLAKHQHKYRAFPEKTVAMINKDDVPLRGTPNPHGEIKAIFMEGHYVNAYGFQGRWIKVEYPGYEGWIYSKDLCFENGTLVDEVNRRSPGIPAIIRKPVIYLYPKHKTQVLVELTYPGKILTTYPRASIKNNTYSWSVLAKSSGKLYIGKKSYPYLFWDAENALNFNLNEGFIVQGSQSLEFLESKLPLFGLNRNEINDFIVYWLPELEKNEYNFITFKQKEYSDQVPLKITPSPDHLIRLCMIFKKAQKTDKVTEQIIQNVSRKSLKGFKAIEWGGIEL